ncbi:uncharacterized protein LOC120215430 [Hibiscus syriacus]|uniref:uncharacterized protein LOC120215430 n=1 Tax=Hibiscus syriacus TaxID=106335 RepID=UPI001920B5C2|nr:uncharacterized protein LOC120215430 [Hibiscus syriacus]
MGLVSVVPHGGAICIALNFDLRLSSVSTTVQSPRWTGLRFTNPRLSVLHSVSHNRQAICFPVARAREWSRRINCLKMRRILMLIPRRNFRKIKLMYHLLKPLHFGCARQLLLELVWG